MIDISTTKTLINVKKFPGILTKISRETGNLETAMQIVLWWVFIKAERMSKR